MTKRLLNFSSPNSETTSEQLKLYQTILDYTTNEVHIWQLVRDEKGEIITWRLKEVNPATLKSWGKKREEVIGKLTDEIFEGAKATETFMPIVKKIFKENKPHFWQTYFSGTNQILDMISIPIGDHFISTGVDVTAKKQAENFIQQAHRMESLGVVAGGVAHDMNNILGIILGHARALKQQKCGNNPDESIDAIINAGKKGRELTSLILSFAKKDETKNEEIDLHLLIEDLVNLLRTSVSSKIKINYEKPTDPKVISANRIHLNQIILNITNNAIQAMGEKGGELTLNLQKEEISQNQIPDDMINTKPGKFVKLSIADTGKGIEDSILESIFNPFFTTNANNKGSGLGLSIVKNLVSNHGGFIDIQSQKGRGSAFHIHLPLSKRE